MVFRTVFPEIDRPDGSNIIVGEEGSAIKQSEGKQVIRAGASKEEADYDIRNHDLTEGEYVVGPADVGGTTELSGIISSEENATFDVIIEWRDENDNVLGTENGGSLSGSDAYLLEAVTIKGDLCQVTLSDTSGASENTINGSLNFH